MRLAKRSKSRARGVSQPDPRLRRCDEDHSRIDKFGLVGLIHVLAAFCEGPIREGGPRSRSWRSRGNGGPGPVLRTEAIPHLGAAAARRAGRGRARAGAGRRQAESRRAQDSAGRRQAGRRGRGAPRSSSSDRRDRDRSWPRGVDPGGAFRGAASRRVRPRPRRRNSPVAALPALAAGPPPLALAATDQTAEPEQLSALEPPPIQIGVPQEDNDAAAPPPDVATIVPPPLPPVVLAPLPPTRPLELVPPAGPAIPYDQSTAIYDISAHTVYLPDGTRLEAHSASATGSTIRASSMSAIAARRRLASISSRCANCSSMASRRCA